MGSTGSDAEAAVDAADFAASLFGADISTSTGLSQSADSSMPGQSTASPSSSAGINWSSLASGAGSLLKSIFGGGSSPPSASSAQLAAATAAQAAQSRNLMIFGGLAVAGVAAFVFLRKKT